MLAQPMEILELKDGESITFHVVNWQQDEGIIRPPWQPQGKAIRIVRVHVPQQEKDHFPFYWDITAAGAIAQLLPYLQAPGFQQKVFTITKHGEAPKARFSLEVK